MVRTRKLLLRSLFFILLPLFLFANPIDDLLETAADGAASGDKSQVFKAHNTYKSAYLKAILAGDDSRARQALEGIVKSGEALGVDVASYKKSALYTTPEKAGIPAKSAPPGNDLVRVRTREKRNELVLVFRENVRKKEVLLEKGEEGGTFRQVFRIPGSLSSRVKKSYALPALSSVELAAGSGFKTIHNAFKNELVIGVLSGGETEAPAPKAAAPDYRKGKTVVVDAGHGGKDSGAVGYKKIMEKEVVLHLALEVEKELKKRGYTVVMTRDRDIFIPLQKRTRMANEANADMFLSIHANAFSKQLDVKGVETYFLSPARTERAKRVAAKENVEDLGEMGYSSQQTFLNLLSREQVIASNKLAIDVQKNLLSSVRSKYSGVHDKGVRAGPFWVLMGAQMTAVLVEIGYITNPTEARRMSNSHYQKYMARGIANGVDSYFMKN